MQENQIRSTKKKCLNISKIKLFTYRSMAQSSAQWLSNLFRVEGYYDANKSWILLQILIINQCKEQQKLNNIENSAIGSDDIRAHDTPRIRPTWRPLSSYTDISPIWRSIYDEPNTPAERITGLGYRYLPVHRDTYGYSPRPIYSHHYGKPS